MPQVEKASSPVAESTVIVPETRADASAPIEESTVITPSAANSSTVARILANIK